MTHMTILFVNRLSRPARMLRLLCILATTLALPAHGETGGKPGANTEALKREAVDLTSRLHRLEEQLLLPAHTQVSVFLSVAENSQASPDSISLDIDGNTVTSHIYTQKEIDALHAGGIQRLYTGNALTGKHKLRASLRLRGKDGQIHTHEADYRFSKDAKTRNIEIMVNSNKPYLAIQSRD